MSPHLHHSGGTICEPVDVPVNKRHFDMIYSHIKYSDKPFMGSVTHPDRATDTVAMAKILFGEKFIELARNVYKINDERARVKLAINNTLGSNIKEVKQYVNY